ncbi:MAG: DUF192 domain-containing protein [Lentisphaerae bacterium]|nr:DUF192 domain-containing protein [Lentisphaerota bacterium]
MKTGALWLNDAAWIGSVRVASSFFQRLRGLLGCRGLGSGCGLLIESCSAVHTVGMRFALDLIFIDAQWRIVACVRGVRPGRWCVPGGLRARRVVEVESGWLDLTQVPVGAHLRWVDAQESDAGSDGLR